MILKLKPSIFIKPVNETCVYALDCEDTENFFFKFENLSKVLIESLSDGIHKDDLRKKILDMYPDVEPRKIEEDLEDFINTVQQFKILSVVP